MFSLLSAALRPRFRALLRTDRPHRSPRRHRRNRTHRAYGCNRGHRAFGRRNGTYRTYRTHRSYWDNGTDGTYRTHRGNGADWTYRTHRGNRADWTYRSYWSNGTHRADRTDRSNGTHRTDRTHRGNGTHRTDWADRGYGRDRRHRTCRRNDDCGGGKRCGNDGDGGGRGDDAQRVVGFSARGRNFAELNIFFERGGIPEGSPPLLSVGRERDRWCAKRQRGVYSARYFLKVIMGKVRKSEVENIVKHDWILPRIKGKRKIRCRINGAGGAEREGCGQS